MAAGRTDPRFPKNLFPDLLQNDKRSSRDQKEQGKQPGIVGGDQPNHHSGETHSRQDQKTSSNPGSLFRGGEIGCVSPPHPVVLKIQKKRLNQLIEIIRVIYVPAGELVVQRPIDIQLCALPVHLHPAVEPGHGQAVFGKVQPIPGILPLQSVIQVFEV